MESRRQITKAVAEVMECPDKDVDMSSGQTSHIREVLFQGGVSISWNGRRGLGGLPGHGPVSPVSGAHREPFLSHGGGDLG